MNKLLRRIFASNDGRMKLRSRPFYPWRIVAAGAAVVALCAIVPAFRTREWLFGTLAVVGGIGYFLIQQHLNEAKFFFELFEKFNKRYGDMNERLQKLLESKQPFTPDDRLFVIDYFNLCSEEWLFFRAGYIDESVWNAWHSGMQVYGSDARFAEVWTHDGSGLTYYNFQFPVVTPSQSSESVSKLT